MVNIVLRNKKPESESLLCAGLVTRSISKRQGGLERSMHWSKRDCKYLYWGTRTAYEA